VGGDERGLVVIPDGIAKGLTGRRGNLVCVVDGLADGFGGLEALKEGIDDEANLRLGVDEGGSEKESKQG